MISVYISIVLFFQYVLSYRARNRCIVFRFHWQLTLRIILPIRSPMNCADRPASNVASGTTEVPNLIACVPSPPSVCRRTQTFRYWQAFLGQKDNLKRMNLSTNFKVLKKCRGKLECLIFEMLIIRNKRPTVNTQADSIWVKRFI